MVFRRRETYVARPNKEDAILAANTVLRWLIVWGRAFADETLESVTSQASAWSSKADGRTDTWLLWALRLEQEAAAQLPPTTTTTTSSSSLPSSFANNVTLGGPASPSQSPSTPLANSAISPTLASPLSASAAAPAALASLAPPPLTPSLCTLILTSPAADAALTSVMTHDPDAQTAAALNSLFASLLRVSDLTALPHGYEVLEQHVKETTARAALQRSVSEEKVEEFAAEEAKRARDAAAVLAARVALFSFISRHAARLRAVLQWTQSSTVLVSFKAHSWPLERFVQY